MAIIESQLEDFLFHEMFNPKTLNERTGLWLGYYQAHFRQINLGPYGIADLMTMEYGQASGPSDDKRNYLDVNIIELKAEGVGPETYLQVARYASGVRHFFRSFVNLSRTEIRINVYLVGKYTSMKPIDCIPIGDVNYVSVYTYNISNDNIFLYKHEKFCKLDMDISWSKRYGSQSFLNLFKNNIRSMAYQNQKRRDAFNLFYSKQKDSSNG